MILEEFDNYIDKDLKKSLRKEIEKEISELFLLYAKSLKILTGNLTLEKDSEEDYHVKSSYPISKEEYDLLLKVKHIVQNEVE